MRVLLFLFVLLAACGRPLTPAEKSFASQIHGPTLDTSKVRTIRGSPVGSITYRREKRPRLACRELILPEPEEEIVTVTPVAMVIHNKVFYSRDWYLDDYLQDYPQQMDLLLAMLFAHEMTHVWQWQNRDITGYSPLKAANEHVVNDDPYLFDLTNQADFLEYGYEQQAGIVEEYVCCATLNPDGNRTKRLKTLLEGVFPMQRLDVADSIIIPWKDAELGGICS